MRRRHGFWSSEIRKGLELLHENLNYTFHSQVLFTGSWKLLLRRINMSNNNNTTQRRVDL